jgi:hypothetical protein
MKEVRLSVQDLWKGHHMEFHYRDITSSKKDPDWKFINFPRRKSSRLEVFNRILSELEFTYNHDFEQFTTQCDDKIIKLLDIVARIPDIPSKLAKECWEMDLDVLDEDLTIKYFASKVRKDK